MCACADDGGLQSASVIDRLDLAELPFPLRPSHAGVWSSDGITAALVATAPARTDLYVDPAGTSSNETSILDAPTLLGTPPAGDFQFSARITVDFAAQYDAGVLLVWIDERHWAKFCFEFSPASEPMIVSVVTRTVSDDANSVVVHGRPVWLRIARLDHVYAFHASTDAQTWSLVRVFSFGESVEDHEIGFEAQSPIGDGCTVRFDHIGFAGERLADLRDGS